MSQPPDEKKAEFHAEIEAAERALAAGHLRDVRRHLAHAESLGVKRPGDLDRVRKHLHAVEGKQRARARLSGWRGFGLAFLAYFVLALQQPPGWGVPLWAALAFVIVPGSIGFLIGRWQGEEHGGWDRFWTAFRAVGGAMTLYAGVVLIVLRARFGLGEDLGQVMLVWLLVTFVYGTLAGSVAGLVSAKLTWRQEKEGRV